MQARNAIAVAGALALLGVGTPAMSQQMSAPQMPVCHERTEALHYLRSNYDEQPVALGLANNGGVIEVLANPDGKTWTILITTPDGHTCPLASGVGWESLPHVVGARS